MAVRRVAVTGLGAVTPIGIGATNFWQALQAGRNGVDRITHFDPSSFPSKMAAEVRDFHPEEWIDKKSARRMDRFTHFGIAASVMAMEDAGLTTAGFDGERAGVIIGSGIGGALTIEEGARVLFNEGPTALNPFFVTKLLINMTACLVSIRFGLQGHISAPSMACSTGANAIGDAFRIIQRGEADIILAGSAEACITPLAYGGFCTNRSMSRRNDDMLRASRPFDRDRDGFVMGEGAGIVILEEMEHARRRGARIYAEITGYGNTADAYHFTAPDPDGKGMARVMNLALADAGIAPADVAYINAHGTSTPLNDKTESSVISKVFGEHTPRLKVSSIKSMIGHLMGAAGAAAMVATVLSVFYDVVPPTINHQEPDPECTLDYVSHEAQPLTIRYAACNSFGFGGGNACLVVKKYTDE
ncbi:MAG: beta-ketoacyl-ACP synthase II [Acidobacteria bacterium]|nr:beta-ketoacyl-ACP synthase II [Acidobacteriota bacterium]